jgi:hypothetical protein
MNELYLLQRKLYNKYEEQVYDEINENFQKRKNERFYRPLYEEKYKYFIKRNHKKITIDLKSHLNLFKKAKTINNITTDDNNNIDENSKYQRALTVTYNNNDNPITLINNDEKNV